MTATRICAEQGCPLPTRAGSPRCAEHHAAHARSKSSRRGYSAHAAGYDASWSKTSERYLRAHPTCECDECVALPLEQRDRSEEVHHVDGLGPRGPRGHDWSNLLAMSHPHHSRLTATDHRISPLSPSYAFIDPRGNGPLTRDDLERAFEQAAGRPRPWVNPEGVG